MSTLAVNTITDANGGNNARLNGPACPDNSMGFRNRIINGDMRIDQRNAGASVTTAGSAIYTLDRWEVFENGSMAFSVQQSTTVPSSSGFTNSIVITTTTAASPSAATRCQFSQYIEGFNSADFGWGAAGAKTVTLSFWVRSSLTGQFGGAIRNGDGTRTYPFSYTISSANTWEQKSITIPGDTSGTWATNNGIGVIVHFDLGCGSDLLGTAGSWASAGYRGATGDVKLAETNGATWYITGVQLEVGSVATPFERRPYGAELSLCQRYFETFGLSSTSLIGASYNTTTAAAPLQWKVTKRASPTITLPSAGQTAGTVSFLAANGNYPATTGSHVTGGITVDKAYIESTSYVGFTQGAAALFYSNGTTTIQISAEL